LNIPFTNYLEYSAHQVLGIFPASTAQAASLLLTLLKASINHLRASGVVIQPQTEESVENLEGLIKHLQERSREGTLRSDKDTYALLPIAGDDLYRCLSDKHV